MGIKQKRSNKNTFFFFPKNLVQQLNDKKLINILQYDIKNKNICSTKIITNLQV